jgi:hypothetical protein
MIEKLTLIDALPQLLVTSERQFPAPTPHTYAHLGETTVRAVTPVVANVQQLFPDLPQAAMHYFPDRPGDAVA